MKEEDFVKARRREIGTNMEGWKPGAGALVGGAVCLLLLLGIVVLGLTTGIGLAIAIPLAVIIVIAGYLVTFRRGRAPRLNSVSCPHCGAAVTAPSHISEAACPSCGRQVELRGGV